MENEHDAPEKKITVKRKLSNEDVIKYEPMVEKFIRDSCMKNWNESRTGPEIFLGASGYSIADLKQHLRAEICIALQNYNPDYRTKDGRSVKESTFVYQHLTFRVGQMMKRLTKKRCGYGIRHNAVHLVIEGGAEESESDNRDLELACDKKYEVQRSKKTQVERFLEAKASRRIYRDEDMCD